MFKRISLISGLALSLALSLSACGNDSKTTTQAAVTPDHGRGTLPSGACDRNYIDTYNNLVSHEKELSKYVNPDGKLTDYARTHMDEFTRSLREVNKSCIGFSKYVDTTCRAVDLSTGETIHVDGKGIKKSCSSVQAAIDQIDHGQPPRHDSNFEESFPTTDTEIDLLF